MAASLNNLFGERKVFLVAPDGSQTELGRATSKECISKEEMTGFRHSPDHYELSFNLHLSRKARTALWKMIGTSKQPKTTYKTIKRNCAKRNR